MRSKTFRFAAGFSLMEMLIALTITAMLLVAVAVAFNASAVNYRENHDIFKTVNSARQALLRMTSQLRDANSVNLASPSNECTLCTADNQSLTYRYNAADKKLYLVDNASGDSYVLCDNVTAMTFTCGGLTKVKSVQISMTVRSGNNERTLPAAAVVRRNL